MTKVKKKGKQKTNGVFSAKNIITRVIPTDWDDLIWDIAEEVLVNQAENMIEDALNGEEEGIQSVETNYVNNYYVTNNYNNLAQNRVITPFRPPNYNPTRRTFRFSPPPTTVVAPILPTEIDTQRSFQTPVGTSISVKDSTSADSLLFGRLKFHPASSQKKGIKQELKTDRILNQFTIAQKEAIKSIDKFKNGQELPIEHTGFLVATDQLKGLRGKGSILYGLNTISTLAQSYRLLSASAFIEPTNEIPVEYEKVKVSNDLQELKFSGKATAQIKDQLAYQLGYDDKEFEDKTIEDVIKDYGKKQYETTTKNLVDALKNLTIGGKPQSTINKIKDLNIQNIEQFACHVLASLFYRNGFHRFPATVPESLIFDNDKYKNPKEQPTKSLDDALEVQEYLLRNLDAVCGQFPLIFDYQYSDEKGEKQTNKIKIPNIAEALIELVGMALNIQTNCDANVVIGLKNLVETVKAGNSAIVAGDYAKANAKYLGYKGGEKEREIPLSFTPGQTELKKVLKDSKQNIISWENQDEDNLVDDIKQILIAAQITKSALVQPFDITKPDQFLTGDSIRQQKKEYKEKYDTEWDDLIKYYNEPNNGTFKPFPKAKLKDRSKPQSPQ